MPSCTPPSGNFFVPEASTNGNFNLNLLALLLSEILRGSEIYTRGPYAPCTLPSGKFFYSKRVLISNCVFNFNFLVFLLFEILGGSQIYTKGPYALWTPPCKKIFVPKASTLQYLIVLLILTF